MTTYVLSYIVICRLSRLNLVFWVAENLSRLVGFDTGCGTCKKPAIIVEVVIGESRFKSYKHSAF